MSVLRVFFRRPSKLCVYNVHCFERPLLKRVTISSIGSGQLLNHEGGRFRIYTRTGDKGVTSTFAGSRLPKDHIIFEALGSTDHLSSTIGHGREFCDESKYHPIPEQLKKIQCILQDIGSHIATPRTKASTLKQERTSFNARHIKELEEWIDGLDGQLPPLKNFILPSGGVAATVLHIARSLCRETERKVVVLLRDEDVNEEVYKYINRLSDYLFVAARFVAKVEGRKEEIYIRPD